MMKKDMIQSKDNWPLSSIRQALLNSSCYPISRSRNLQQEQRIIRWNHALWCLWLIKNDHLPKTNFPRLSLPASKSLNDIQKWLKKQSAEAVVRFSDIDDTAIRKALERADCHLILASFASEKLLLRDANQQRRIIMDCSYEDGWLYLPAMHVHSSRKRLGKLYMKFSPCLYYDYPLAPPSFIIFTDTLINAVKSNQLRKHQHHYNWCSFYSSDDSIREVDLSPLAGKLVVVVIYPHEKRSHLEQLKRSYDIGEALLKAQVKDVLYASYVTPELLTNDLPGLMFKEPLFFDHTELLKMSSAPVVIRNEVPDWTCPVAFFQRDLEQALIEMPDIRTGDVVYLLGGSIESKSRFVLTLAISLAEGRAILPGSKVSRQVGVLAFLSTQYLTQIEVFFKTSHPDSSLKFNTQQEDEPKLVAAIPYRELCSSSNNAVFRAYSIRDSQTQPSDWLSHKSQNFIKAKIELLAKLSPIKLLIIDEPAICGRISQLPGAETAYLEFIHSLVQRGISVLLLGNSRHQKLSGRIWRIDWEARFKAGLSFSLTHVPRCPPIHYKLLLGVFPRWQKGKRIPLEQQKKMVQDLYDRNQRSPFGSGQGNILTVSDIEKATGLGESQIKKIRGLLGFAKKCPQRGRRNAKIAASVFEK